MSPLVPWLDNDGDHHVDDGLGGDGFGDGNGATTGLGYGRGEGGYDDGDGLGRGAGADVDGSTAPQGQGLDLSTWALPPDVAKARRHEKIDAALKHLENL